MRIILLMLLSSFLSAAEIDISWSETTQREDGSAVIAPISYRLYHVIDNTEQPTIELSAGTVSHNITNAITGLHTFQISAVENGLEGGKSAPASKQVNGSRPGRVVITIDCIGCN